MPREKEFLVPCFSDTTSSLCRLSSANLLPNLDEKQENRNKYINFISKPMVKPRHTIYEPTPGNSLNDLRSVIEEFSKEHLETEGQEQK